MKDSKQVNQEVALYQETETAVRLIQVGLRELQKIDAANSFYHLPLLTLANGIERLLKVTLCIRVHQTKERFPDQDDIFKGKQGHNLTILLRRVIDDCFTEQYIKNSPFGAEDFKFLKEGQPLGKVIKILSEFGDSSRYYTLNIVFDNKNYATASPESEWERLETELLEKRPDLQAKLGGGNIHSLDEIYSYIRLELTESPRIFRRPFYLSHATLLDSVC